jgi:cellobiose phosphorylase
MKSFATKYGRFSDDGMEYIVTTPRTPRPWINVISNGDYGITVSQTGSGYSWRTHAQLNRITRWEQDLIKDEWGKYIYLRNDKGKVWSAGWKPVCVEPEAYRCRHGMGYSVIESKNFGIETELVMFVPNNEPLEVWKLTVRNTTRRPQKLRLFSYMEWCLGSSPDWHREFHRSFIETSYDRQAQALMAVKRLWEIPTDRGHWNADWKYMAFHGSSRKPFSFDADKASFLGMYGSTRLPAAVANGRLQKNTGNWLDPIACLGVPLSLKPGQEHVVVFTVGAADSREQAVELCSKYQTAEAADAELARVRERWERLLTTVHIETPDPAMDIMENTWLKYQAISGRLWGRTAYYQIGGAYGFRDQLQDSQVFLPIDPARTRDQILLHARHQFKDGTVYHWWHPISETGLHNTISDNLLWLPYVVNSYLQETADFSILELREPFVDDASGTSIYDHCRRAIDKALERMSGRGLPLIGAGDWNDGLSAVGLDGKGESVWLGHFLHRVLLDFSIIAERRGDRARVELYTKRARRLYEAVNNVAWDGDWYFRATTDEGVTIGSKQNTEGKVFLNAQTWSVISGVAPEERARQVMDVVEKELDLKAGPVLLHPAYSVPDRNIGYLTRYAAGMRENGGVYTHAATWAVIAEAILGRGDKAFQFYSKINPINRGQRPEEYVAEPYVTAGNIEGPESDFYGRGGWTWYTGSAAWLFKVGLEWILGVRPTLDGLLLDPCVPAGWNGFTVTRIFRGAAYKIEVINPYRVQTGVGSVLIDGEHYEGGRGGRGVVLPLFGAGEEHTIVVSMGQPGSGG